MHDDHELRHAQCEQHQNSGFSLRRVRHHRIVSVSIVPERSTEIAASQPADAPDAGWESWWQRRSRAKREARRVRRVLYGFELWSVLKVSLLFYLCAWGVFLLAGSILWNVANSLDYVERFENFVLEIFNYETFSINGDELFRWYFWLGLFSVLVLTVLTVVLCLLYNLISVLIGGLRVTLVEEETVRFRQPLGRDNHQADRQASSQSALQHQPSSQQANQISAQR